MREGIHLGRPAAKTPRPLGILAVVAVLASFALGWRYRNARAEAEALEREIAGLRASAAARTAPSADGEHPAAARLRLVLDAGAPDAPDPTALLALVEAALPRGVVLESLGYGARPAPSLLIELSALEPDSVTELQRRLAAAPAVGSTSLLEERRESDGSLSVRVQVGLKRP
jgi:hypothetical protein